MLWITSDLHFGHENMVKSGLRPRDFEKRIIRNWNGQVKESDTVIVLGDVAWKNGYSIIGKLKGRKILTKGNHDSKSAESYLKIFDFACETFSIKYNGVDIIFSHKPLNFFTQDLNIHGHLHNREPLNDRRHILISLEKMGYGVFSLPYLIKKWKEQ